jgi:tRNA1Val (adenine37-N6)-methyltransferase
MSHFHFKKFSIQHQISSMKIGTDAVLLGAWCSIPVGSVALEVGSGCGVISCMLAQRGIRMTGVDFHENSVIESIQNAQSLPFDNSPDFIHADFFEYTSNQKFHSIVSNPPFFIHSLKAPNHTRSNARHLDEQWIGKFWKQCAQLTNEVHLVVPFIDSMHWVNHASRVGFKMTRKCSVYSFEQDQFPIRLLLEFKVKPTQELGETRLVLYNENKSRTKDYTTLCEDFYL